MSEGIHLAAPTHPTVVEVWAPSCSACRAMKPDLEALAAEHASSVEVRLVNAAEEADVAASLGVRATPTLIGFRDGVEVFRVAGRRSRAELEELFASLADGRDAENIGRHDLVLRVGTGVVLGAVGLAMGPAWPLVAVGAGIAGLGALAGFRSR